MGGALFFNKEKYTEIGLENEKFISWGHEDWERVVRIEKMGLKLCRVQGNLYHLTHIRSHNSSGSNPYYRQNGEEYNKVRFMNIEQLKEYIKSWEWIK